MSSQNPEVVVTCQDCGTIVDEDPSTPVETKQPCPSCGSKTRLIKVHAKAERVMEVHESAHLKARMPGEEQQYLEVEAGDSLYVKTGEYNQLKRVIDRQNDRYQEHIVNPRTGEVIRDVDEPLSEHIGHGSAKNSKKPK